MDDLIERLRGLGNWEVQRRPATAFELLTEAADALQSLAAENARLKALVHQLGENAATAAREYAEGMENARNKALEEAAGVVQRFADCALKCGRCGDVRHTYAPGGCLGEAEFKQSEEGRRMIALDGAFEAMRYFEKHLCRPEEMEQPVAFVECATAIRALKGPDHG